MSNKMHLKIFSMLAVVQVVFSQGITFQDGQLGVNFGGYNAGVGFGPGGLSASAGTPDGQRAEAGLGGTINGNTAGGLYAGATAGKGIGASASLGGDLNSGIGSGQAESYAGGVSTSAVKSVSTDVDTEVDDQYQIPMAMQSFVTQAPVAVVVPHVAQLESQVDTKIESNAPHPSHTTPKSVTEPTVGPVVQYLPPKVAATAPEQAAPVSSIMAQGSESSPSTSELDADDNDLAPNTVPQMTIMVAQKPKPVKQQQQQQQVVVTQTVPQVAHIQKIKVRRPRPSTYTVYQKQYQIPTFSKTIQYPAPVYQQQPAAPIQFTQIPFPAYQPIVYQKRIHFNTVPQVAVEQRFEEDAVPQGPTTTTTPRPVYQYTYDKTKVINEIFSIPYHILNSVNSLINAKLAGGYQVQKTVVYN